MKKIIFTSLFLISCGAIIAQTYNMKIKQGVGFTFSATTSIDEITFLNTTTTPFVCGDVILYGGETYHTISIGSQCWFQENLNIGTRINGSTNQNNNGTIEKYCYNDLAANCVTYGGLYQWAEVVQYLNGATNTTSPNPAFSGNVQGICPTGWHIPMFAEFTTLATAVSDNGNALKAVGQGTGSGVGTNTSGFSALLAGSHSSSFLDLGGSASFWGSTEFTSVFAVSMGLYNGDIDVGMSSTTKNEGFSVRCVKD